MNSDFENIVENYTKLYTQFGFVEMLKSIQYIQEISVKHKSYSDFVVEYEKASVKL